jgi:hypothetical protein
MRRGLIALAVLAACTSSSEDLAGAPTPSVTGPPAPFVRTCDSSVFGELGRDFEDGSVVAGPVVFVGIEGYERLGDRWFRVREGRAPAIKVLLVVRGKDPVTISIAGDVPASLAYDPAMWRSSNVVPLSAGDAAVTFEPCGGGPQRTQFNGAFLVSGPRCVPVEVAIPSGETLRAELPFGTSCP